MKTRQVVKVQLPIAGNTQPVALIYAKGKVGMQTREIDDALVAKMNGHVKRFFFATIEDGKWVLGKPAPWRKW